MEEDTSAAIADVEEYAPGYSFCNICNVMLITTIVCTNEWRARTCPSTQKWKHFDKPKFRAM